MEFTALMLSFDPSVSVGHSNPYLIKLASYVIEYGLEYRFGIFRALNTDTVTGNSILYNI